MRWHKGKGYLSISRVFGRSAATCLYSALRLALRLPLHGLKPQFDKLPYGNAAVGQAGKMATVVIDTVQQVAGRDQVNSFHSVRQLRRHVRSRHWGWFPFIAELAQ